MVSAVAVGIAASLQLILGISFFFEQNPDLCSTAPSLASWLFAIAIFDILLDVGIFPIRYMHLPYACQIAAETIVAILLTEFSIMIVWCNTEKICCKLCKSMVIIAGLPPNIYYAWERYILGTATTALSLTFLLCVGQATDHFYILRKKSVRSYRKTIDYISHLWQKSKQHFWKNNEAENNNSAALSYKCQLPQGRQDEDTSTTYTNDQFLQPNKHNRRNRSRSGRNR